MSPDSEFADEDSPDNDLRSSVSSPLGGEDAEDPDDVPYTLDNSDMDRSNGESKRKTNNENEIKNSLELVRLYAYGQKQSVLRESFRAFKL